MIRVSVIPPWPEKQQNDGLFALTGFREWQTTAKAAGFSLHTHDLLAPDDADIIWCIDLAEDVFPLWAIRNLRRAGKPVVLQILESPLVKPLSHHATLHTHFTSLVTYGPAGTGELRAYRYRIPVELSPVNEGLAYLARHLVAMMNTNQHADLGRVSEAAKHPNLPGSPTGRRVRAWCARQRARRAELYSWRRHLARAAERFPEQTLEVYGRGWHGEIAGERPYRCAAGEVPASIIEASSALAEKLAVLGRYRFTIATENYRGGRDYISEKIIHPLLAGSVPVYLGDENIASVVPPAAFIDARRFRHPARLLQYLAAFSEDAWHTAQRAGRAWLQTPSARAFSGHAFAHMATRVLTEVAI